MLKEFKKGQAIIQIDEDGEVIYIVGKKKTTFNLRDCEDFTYYYNDGTKTIIDRTIIDGTIIDSTIIGEASLIAADRDQIDDNGLWLLILKGEESLERNNYHTETRRHESYDNKNDKWNVFADKDTDIEADIIKQADAEELRNAIDSLLPQQKELIYKVYFQQLTIAEIAKIDEVDKSAISHRLKKAYLRMQKYLGKKQF